MWIHNDEILLLCKNSKQLQEIVDGAIFVLIMSLISTIPPPITMYNLWDKQRNSSGWGSFTGRLLIKICQKILMAPWYGTLFPITCLLLGKSTDHRWSPLTKGNRRAIQQLALHLVHPRMGTMADSANHNTRSNYVFYRVMWKGYVFIYHHDYHEVSLYQHCACKRSVTTDHRQTQYWLTTNKKAQSYTMLILYLL